MNVFSHYESFENRRGYIARTKVIAQQGKLVNWHLCKSGNYNYPMLSLALFSFGFSPLFEPRSSGPRTSCLFIAGSQVQLAFSKFVQNYCQLRSGPTRLGVGSGNSWMAKTQCRTTLGCLPPNRPQLNGDFRVDRGVSSTTHRQRLLHQAKLPLTEFPWRLPSWQAPNGNFSSQVSWD